MKLATPERQARIWEVLKKRQKDLTMIMDNIHDPHNVSAIIRSCDAFGVPLIHLYYTSESVPEIGHKSSGSANKWVYTERHYNPETLMQKLGDQGFQIIGTGKSEMSRSILEWDFTKPTAIIMGNEHRGVSPELRPYINGELYIPMLGMVESLNVSVAAAIILYESWRQRRHKCCKGSGMYDQATLNAMFQSWMQK